MVYHCSILRNKRLLFTYVCVRQLAGAGGLPGVVPGGHAAPISLTLRLPQRPS